MTAAKKRSTVYISEDVWDEFKVICVREGISISSKLEGWIYAEVQKHKPGNPQHRLDTYGMRDLTPTEIHALCKHKAYSHLDFGGAVASCMLERGGVAVGQFFERCKHCKRWERI